MFREVFEADSRDPAQPQKLTGLQTAMAGDESSLPVDQEWDIEPECLNAVSNLLNLFFGMAAWILRVSYQFPDINVDYRQLLTCVKFASVGF